MHLFGRRIVVIYAQDKKGWGACDGDYVLFIWAFLLEPYVGVKAF